MDSILIDGSCHCGNISLRYRLPEKTAEIPARACDCGFCTRHGARWTSHPHGVLRINIADQTLLHQYRFASNSADFLLCQQCGVPMAAVSEIAGQRYAVINLNALSLPPDLSLDESASSFGGEALDDRLDRRTRNWIGQVTLITA